MGPEVNSLSEPSPGEVPPSPSTSTTAPAAGHPAAPKIPASRLILIAVLAALIYGAMLAFADLRALRSAFAAFPLALVPWILFLVVAGYGLRAWRWHAYLVHLGSRATPAISLLTFVGGFALGVTPGKAGELIKTYYLQRYAGTAYRTSFSAAVTERVTDAIALVTLLIVGISGARGVSTAIVIGASVVLVGGVLVLRSNTIVGAILHWMERLPGVRRVAPWLADVYSGVRRLVTLRWLTFGSALGIASWAIEVGAVWWLAHGFGLDLTWRECAVVFAAASLFGVLTFIPGGLGATEGSMVALLGYLGVSLADATALTIATRVSTLWFSVALGAGALAILRATHRPHNVASPAGDS